MSRFFRKFKFVIEARLQEPNPLIQVLIGPRQVGKTTAIKQIFSQRGIYFSADSPLPLGPEEIEAHWKQAMEMEDPWLAIDEIQKISSWSEMVKKLWDARTKPIKLVLLGSAALSIEKDLKESLAGRYELVRVEHWNFSEASSMFQMSLQDYLEFGCYPGSIQFLQDRDRWGQYIRDSIVEPAIGRDILQLHPVENPALLRQVFSICVGHPSQIISLNKIQGSLQDRGAVATLQRYLHLLGLGFLATGVQKFSSNAIREKMSPPKLIIHDNALIRAFERPIHATPSSERLGFYIENAVGARLIESGWDCFYWKDKKLEVDFIAMGPGGEKLALEVKTQAPSLQELQGLMRFCQENPEFTACVVCPTKVHLKGVRWIDLKDILSISRFSNTY